MRTICDRREEVLISTLTKVWRKVFPTFMNNFEGFRISEEEVIAEVEEIGRELEVKLKM